MAGFADVRVGEDIRKTSEAFRLAHVTGCDARWQVAVASDFWNHKKVWLKTVSTANINIKHPPPNTEDKNYKFKLGLQLIKRQQFTVTTKSYVQTLEMSIRTEDLFHMQYLIQEKKSNYFRKYLRPQNLDHFGHHKRSSNSHKNANVAGIVPIPRFQGPRSLPHSEGQSGPEICGAPLTH